MSAVEWYKSHTHISFLSSYMYSNSYVPTQCEQDIVWANVMLVHVWKVHVHVVARLL